MNKVYNSNDFEMYYANSQGTVEHGYVSLTLNGVDIGITIQQRSDGYNTFLLDDHEHKEKLELCGVKFKDNETITGPEQFLSDLFRYYDQNTPHMQK